MLFTIFIEDKIQLNIYFKKNNSIKAKKGNAKSIESIISRIPPNPLNLFEESFALQNRFKPDSKRSPIIEKMLVINIRINEFKLPILSLKKSFIKRFNKNGISVPNRMAPMNPFNDLFGETGRLSDFLGNQKSPKR